MKYVTGSRRSKSTTGKRRSSYVTKAWSGSRTASVSSAAGPELPGDLITWDGEPVTWDDGYVTQVPS